MKHQNQKITASTTATFSSGLLRRNNWLATTVAAAAISLAVADHAAAAPISKADTADNLTVPTSWVGGVVPTSADVAVWDSTVATAANASTPALGADTNWAGILISNPSGPVAIPAGNTLSLGASGVDMSAASQGLNLACGLTLTANQTFNITSGMNLTNTGVIGGGFSITRAGAGTWTLPTAGSTYTGGTILASGTNQIASIGNGHFGTGSITLTNGAVLALFSASTGDPGGGGGAFTNALIVPAGMTGTLWNHWRGAFSGPLTGSGTLNMRANGVRGDITGNWTNFAGSINLTSRTGNDDLRIRNYPAARVGHRSRYGTEVFLRHQWQHR